MSKNKFRLTKQDIKDGEKTYNFKREIKNSEIHYFNKGNEIKIDEVIKIYNKNIQIEKRVENFSNSKRKKIYESILESNEEELQYKGYENQEKIKTKETYKTVKSYNNRYKKDIPFAIDIENKENDEKIKVKKEMYEYKVKLLGENKYENLIKKVYNEILTEEFLKKFSLQFTKRFNKNKFIEILMIEKVKVQTKYMENIKNKDNEEEKKELYLKLNLSKLICNRIKTEVREKCSIEDEKKDITYENIEKNVGTINKEEIINFIINKLRMNIIDYNKTYYNKEKKFENSYELENLRQKEILSKKLVETISRANTNITRKRGWDYSENEIDSLDIFGGNKNLKNYGNGLNKDESLYNELKKYKEEIYFNFAKRWNLVSETNKVIKIIVDEEIKDIVDKVIKSIVEIRSYVVHKKEELQLNEIDTSSDVLEEDKKIYKEAIIEKYISNSVLHYFEFKEIENIFKQSVTIDFKFIQNNYMPRFDKIIKRLKYDKELVLSDEECDIPLSNALKFLYKEIYMNDFRKYLDNSRLDKEFMECILKQYKKSNTKLELETSFEDNKHSEEYKKVSIEISKGNLSEIQTIWEMYISQKFNCYIKNNYTEINQENKINNEKKNQIDEAVEKFKKECEEIKIEFELENEKNIIFYYLSKLVTRRELNELMNTFKSYWQYLDSKKIEIVDEIFKKDNINNLYNMLSINLELINRKIEPLKNNKPEELKCEEEEILKMLVQSDQGLEIYKDDKNKIEFKSLRMVQEENTPILFDKLLKNSIKKEYTNKYKVIKKELSKSQKEISEKIKEYKEDIKKEPRTNSKKFEVTFEGGVVFNWNKNLENNFIVNTVELFTVRKVQKFMIEIYSLYVRTIQSIERDFLLFINCEDLYKTPSRLKKDNLNITILEKVVKKEQIEQYFAIRNEIAHYNYFNSPGYGKSLEDLYKEIRKILKYNSKRRKSFRLSLEYIFEKNNLFFEVDEKTKEVSIKIMKHPYAYKHKDVTEKFKENETQWNELKLICEEEKRLLEKVYTDRNG